KVRLRSRRSRTRTSPAASTPAPMRITLSTETLPYPSVNNDSTCSELNTGKPAQRCAGFLFLSQEARRPLCVLSAYVVQNPCPQATVHLSITTPSNSPNFSTVKCTAPSSHLKSTFFSFVIVHTLDGLKSERIEKFMSRTSNGSK